MSVSESFLGYSKGMGVVSNGRIASIPKGAGGTVVEIKGPEGCTSDRIRVDFGRYGRCNMKPKDLQCSASNVDSAIYVVAF